MQDLAIPGLIIQKLKSLKNKINPSQPGTVPKSFIKKFLPDNPVILEAGAHKGTDTVEMANYWLKGIIHAFEPVPSIYSQLTQNTKHLDNVKCYPLALGSRTGPSEMYLSSGASDGSSSLLKPKEHRKIHPDVFFLEKIQVQQITIDCWAKQNNIQNVDFLWLDLEGNELSALKKSQTILHHVKAVYSEVNLVENYKGCALYPVLRNWMADMGFTAQKEAMAWSSGGNVLFVRTS
jgi:FkbM family methyltransferase